MLRGERSWCVKTKPPTGDRWCLNCSLYYDAAFLISLRSKTNSIQKSIKALMLSIVARIGRRKRSLQQDVNRFRKIFISKRTMAIFIASSFIHYRLLYKLLWTAGWPSTYTRIPENHGRQLNRVLISAHLSSFLLMLFLPILARGPK